MTRRTWAMVLGFSLIAMILSWWVAQEVFLRAPITTDEQSYIMQAHLLAEGSLKHPTPPFLQAFRYPMIILDQTAGWFSRYPPGHSLWLAIGIWFGSMYGMVALAAGLGVMMTMLCARRLGGSMVAVGLGLTLSPFFAFNFGTLMSHTTGFVAAAGMLLGYILWRQTGRNLWAILAGIAWGWLVLNRTYTALLIALPFAVDSLWQLWKHRREASAWWGTGLFAGSACSGIAALLLYNYLTLGDPFQMTYLYFDPSDKLGFGWRHNHPVFPAPEPVFHTLAKGLSDLRDNLFLLDRWLFGFPGGLVVWAALTLIGWSRRWSLLLVTSAVSVWLGYILFWYPGWNETGPNYYTETQPAMVLTASLGIAALRHRYRAQPRAFIAAVALALLAWGSFSFAFSLEKGREQRAQLEPRARVLELFETAPPKSLIFVKRDIIEAAWPNHDLVFNPRGLKGDVIIARWLDASNGALVRYFDDYTPKVFDVRDDGISLAAMTYDPYLKFDLPIGQLGRRTGTNIQHPDDAKRLVRVARAGEHGKDWFAFGRHFSAYPARFKATFDVEITGAESDEMALTIDVSAGRGRTILATKTFYGNREREAETLVMDIDSFVDIEPRAYYQGAGNVKIYSILLEAIDEPGAPSSE